MTNAADLERGYRRWLRWYPTLFRHEHEEEMLTVLLAGARAGQRRPEVRECFDLLRSAVWMHLVPRVPRSDRSVLNAVKLMYCGALIELAVAITIVATMGDVRSSVVQRDPALTADQWHAVVVGQLEPTAVAAGLAVGFWLWMAWSLGHGQRWARIAFALFFGLNTYSLFTGLAGGSAIYARQDLVSGSVLWLVELASAALIFRLKRAASPSGASRSAAWGRRRGTR